MPSHLLCLCSVLPPSLILLLSQLSTWKSIILSSVFPKSKLHHYVYYTLFAININIITPSKKKNISRHTIVLELHCVLYKLTCKFISDRKANLEGPQHEQKNYAIFSTEEKIICWFFLCDRKEQGKRQRKWWWMMKSSWFKMWFQHVLLHIYIINSWNVCMTDILWDNGELWNFPLPKL